MYRFLIVLGSLFVLGACDNAPAQKEIYSILIDGTDPQITKPNAKEIMDYIGLDDNKELVIRITELSDVDFKPFTQLHFKPESGLLSNQLKEKKKQREFKKALYGVISSNDSILPSAYSNIFDPICNELKYISNLEGFDKAEILVYSDLFENNSQWMSFYHKRNKRLLLNEDKKLREIFLKRIPKTSNKEVAIKVVHVPKGQKENVEFSAVRKLYQKVFSHSQIPISFSGNLVQTHNLK